ncbi:MAG: aminotransferase class IV [Kofleriaceae bacterium]
MVGDNAPANAVAPTIVIDGHLVDAARATISVLDRGLLYGDGLFEVLRTWNGRAVDLDAHLDRLAESAHWMLLPIDRAAIVRDVQVAIDAANPSTTNVSSATSVDLRIRIVVTRGPGGLAVPMASAGPGHTIVIAEPIGRSDDTMPETSLALVDWPLPKRVGRGHKTLAYLDHVIARELARERGAEDAVRLDADGRIAEGGTCNVFAVHDGIVYAPSDGAVIAPRATSVDTDARSAVLGAGAATHARTGGVLPGVTAARVVAICRRADIPVAVGPIEVTHFFAADEIFVTSAVRGVVAVTQLVADGERSLPVGVLTRRIRAAYVGEMTDL